MSGDKQTQTKKFFSANFDRKTTQSLKRKYPRLKKPEIVFANL